MTDKFMKNAQQVIHQENANQNHNECHFIGTVFHFKWRTINVANNIEKLESSHADV